jgi:hypothetical protein
MELFRIKRLFRNNSIISKWLGYFEIRTSFRNKRVISKYLLFRNSWVISKFDSLKKFMTIAGNDEVSPDRKESPSLNPGIREKYHFPWRHVAGSPVSVKSNEQPDLTRDNLSEIARLESHREPMNLKMSPNMSWSKSFWVAHAQHDHRLGLPSNLPELSRNSGITRRRFC